MEFERYCTDAIEAFEDLKSNLTFETIFNEFKEYVGDEDIKAFMKYIGFPYNETSEFSLEEQYNKLSDKISYSELVEKIQTYFSKSELSGFDEYLYCMYDID